MKKLLLILVVIIASYSYSSAQELGVRFGGDVSGGNVAIDGIFGTGEFNRIHADVSFGHGVGIDVLWDFLYRPLGDEAFNWYAGVGPYVKIGDNNNGNDNDNDGDFDFGVAGEIGLEYRFSTVPIALGIDWRPKLEVIDNTSFHAGGFGLNVRYVFGS